MRNSNVKKGEKNLRNAKTEHSLQQKNLGLENNKIIIDSFRQQSIIKNDCI